MFNKILANYHNFDQFLLNFSNESIQKNSFMSIRLLYCAILGKKEITLIQGLKHTLKLIIRLVKLPFFVAEISQKNSVLIVGKHRLDYEVSKLTKIPCTHIELRKRQKFSASAWKIYFKILKIFGACIVQVIRNPILEWKIFFCSAYGLLDFLVTYYTVKLDGIKVIVTESDSMPIDFALLLKAKENNIKSIKIDHFLIDPINHNRLFCDYYFYPCLLHFNIMKSFNANSHVKYKEGGFLHWDQLAMYQYSPTLPKKICFFTQHGGILGQKDEIYYINEILEVLPPSYTLSIKIHPFDSVERYSIFQQNPNIEIVFGTIDNYALIAEATICLSICSTLTLEAKHVCENSFFINYEPDSLKGFINYEGFHGVIETLTSREMLSKAICGEFERTKIDNFLKGFNLSYPHAVKRLLSLIEEVNNEKTTL